MRCLDRTESKRAAETLRKALEDMECKCRERITELQLANDRLTALIDSIPDEVWFADTNKRVTLVNPAVLREFGETSHNESVEKIASTVEVYRPDGSPRPAEEAPPLRALNGEVVKDQEEIVRIPASGELRYRQVNSSPVKDASGSIIGSVSIVHDITEHKRVEAMLRKNEKQQAFLLKLGDKLRLVSDPIEIQAVVTRAAMDYFGADRCYYCEIVDDNAIIRHDATRGDLPSVAGVYPLSSLPIDKALVDAGRPYSIPDVYTTELVDQELKQLCIQMKVISFINVPVVKNGKPAGILCIVQSTKRDWTDSEVEVAVEIAERTWDAAKRAHAEKALCDSEDSYRRVVQNTSAIILRLDSHGIIHFANQRALEFFGFAEDELIGKSTLGTIIPERETDGRDLVAMVQEITADPDRFRTNANENIRKTGERVWMEWTNSAIYDGEGRIKEFLAVGIDATERKKAEELLRESDRQKNQFLATLSHELRNPLAAIRNGLAILKQTPGSDEQTEHTVQIIDRQSAHLCQLVDDLLDVTRINQNKITLHREQLDLNEILRQVTEDHRALFETSGLELKLELGQIPLPMNGDRTRLTQIFCNLLHNAVKFTPHCGKIHITAELDATQEQAEVHIADNGVGIPSEAISQLFQPFVQIDSGLERRNGGLGLGLALVKSLVDLHGGHVSASSAGLGAGTEFTVRLPLDKHFAEEAPAAAPIVIRPRRILLIDDNHDLADTLRELLEIDDHKVAIAYSGPEGLNKAREFSPDVVLCDIGLPGMDGYEVARLVRADASIQKVYLIALTGYALPEDLQRVMMSGFDKHLAKPLELSTLQQILAQLPA